MSYWVIKSANNEYWGAADWCWSVKLSSAVKFVEKDDAARAIQIIDVDEADPCMMPYEVKE